MTAGGPSPRLACLCFVEGGASAATARYLLRRARRRMPDVPAMALAWSAEGDGVVAAALEAEGQSAPLLLARSIAEAVDLAVETACAGAAEAPVAATPPAAGTPVADVAARADAPASGGTTPAPA